MKKNIILLVMFGTLLAVSITVEPKQDIIDTFAGASTDTFNPTIDDIVGASIHNDHDEHEIEDD